MSEPKGHFEDCALFDGRNHCSCDLSGRWKSWRIATLEAALAAEKRDAERLRDGLQWYADGKHVLMDPEWEVEEGWLCPPNEESWMVEPGYLAKAILNGMAMNPDSEADLNRELLLELQAHQEFGSDEYVACEMALKYLALTEPSESSKCAAQLLEGYTNGLKARNYIHTLKE